MIQSSFLANVKRKSSILSCPEPPLYSVLVHVILLMVMVKSKCTMQYVLGEPGLARSYLDIIFKKQHLS